MTPTEARRPLVRLPGRHLSMVLVLALAGCADSAPHDATTVATAVSAPGSPAESSPPQAGELPPFADVPFYRTDVLGGLVDPGPGPVATPALAWDVAIGATHWAPILVDGLVVIGTAAGALVALDGRTGEVRWRFQADSGFFTDSFNGTAAAADGLVFVSGSTTTYALDAATGSPRWSAPTPTKGSRPLVVDGVVDVGTIGGAVGLDERTGSVVWRWTGPQDVATIVGPVVDGVAYLSSRSDGRLYAIDIRDGTERWSFQTIAVAVGSSEVVGDTVYVGTNQAGASEPLGQVYAVDRATGRQRWQFGAPLGGQVVPGPVRDGIIYVSGETDGIWALHDDGSGWSKVWQRDAPASVLPLSMVGETLYEQRRDGSMAAYAAADGSLLWETPATGDDGGGPPLVDGGMVFRVGDASGVAAYADPALVAALPSAAPPPAQSPTLAPPALPDPFTVVKTFPWAATKLVVPLGIDVGPDGLLYILDTKPSVTVIDPKDGHIARTWGSQGTGLGQFDLTRRDDNSGYGDIAVSPNGNVYVADGSNSRVEVFQPDSEPIAQFGTYGSGDAQFGFISELTIGRDGSVYVLDESANRVSKWTAEGKFVWRSRDAAAEPDLANYLHGIAVRADGAILMTCEQCGRFLVLDPADGHVRERLAAPSIGGDQSGPTNLDRSGNIYVAVYGSSSELMFDRRGRLIGGLEHDPAQPMTMINRQVDWGDTFWPSPVFDAGGHGYTFWTDGLIELKVSLPAR